jgi:hypothetical protein
MAFVALFLGLLLLAAPRARAGDFTTNTATPSSALSGWPASNLYDGNVGTSWSSNSHSSSANTEWLAFWWSQGMQPTNYVKLLPRYSGSTALAFPVSFTINYSNGSQWVQVASYTSYPTPGRGDWIVLPLPGTFNANGIQIVATTLGADNYQNYYFQLAEARAGYEAGFQQFSYVGNNLAALPGANQIQGVGANAFNPNRLSHWDYDDRGVVISPNSGTLRNIYAPQAVNTGNGSWNVYFGGWDGSSAGYDQISMTTTADNFNSFSAHSLVIGNGSYIHCNNDSTLKLGANNWRMAYTTYPNGTTNKPAYATSTDGIHWTPSSGSSAYLLKMSGYSNWTNADVNGGNTLYFDSSGVWHLYFIDFSSASPGGVLHATSLDGVNFTYQGQALSNGVVPQELKAFTYNGTKYYVGAYHANSQYVWTTVSTNLTNLGPLIQSFTNQGSADQYIVASGLVQDGTRIYGMLYGAGAVPTLDQNRIFAAWLQKKVIFQNSYVRWGDIEHGFGPTNIRLFLAAGDNVETGKFYVYDSDGTTLLYTSPTVTMRAGDIWTYTGP